MVTLFLSGVSASYIVRISTNITSLSDVCKGSLKTGHA